MFELIKSLSELPGVSGSEERVRERIIKEISPYADYKVDALGNLIVEKKGLSAPQKKLMLCAHMDEVGLIVTSIDTDGFLRFSPVGGIDPKVLLGAKVIINNQISGVIGSKPIHLLEKSELKSAVKIENLYIDIGASTEAEAKKHVSLGDVASFKTHTEVFGNGFIKGKALDDRVGCALLISLIKRELPFDAVFVFSVQEEVGTRGAAVAAYEVSPDAAIAVETTTAADIPGIDKHNRVCSLGEGPAISFMDLRAIYDREYYKAAFEIADRIGIHCQPKAAVAGGNDAGAISLSKSGVRVLSVSVPCRYLHSPVSVICESDVLASENLLCELINDIAGNKI